MKERTKGNTHATLPVKQEPVNTPTQKPERFLDKQDIMLMLHISPRTLYTWRKEAILPFVKIRNKIFYRESDVEKLLVTGVIKKAA